MNISSLALKMSDVFKLKNKISKNNLVCDATPDAPRSVNSNSVYDRPNLSQEDQQQKNEQKANIPFINNNETSATNSASGKSDKPKSNGTNSWKPPKSKKSSKPSIAYYNIVDSTNVKIGSTTVHTYNLNNYQNSDHKSCNRSKDENKEEIKQMLPHIQAFSESKQILTKEDMLLIKTHLGSGWKKVAKKIGFSKGEIDQFVEDHKHKGMGEVIYKLLIAWKNARTEDATIGHLVDAMWKSMEYECVEQLAMAYNIEA